MGLTAAAFVARIAVLPLLGPAAHRLGTRAIFRAAAVCIVPLPALWLVSDAYAWLLLVQVLAGAAWAGLEYATQLSFFESLHEHDRASILTVFNLASMLAVTTGCGVATLLFRWGDGGRDAYALLFVVSAAARLVPLAFLRRVPTHEIPISEVALRTLAVRPSAGAIQRPVLPALDEAETRERKGGA